MDSSAAFPDGLLHHRLRQHHPRQHHLRQHHLRQHHLRQHTRDSGTRDSGFPLRGAVLGFYAQFTEQIPEPADLLAERVKALGQGGKVGVRGGPLRLA
jgi:hypothetical protein